VLDQVAEQPGHRTPARHAYAVYLRWCEHAEPEAPLTYAPFVAVLDGWAPHEGRDVEHRQGRRGRPSTVFLGVIVRQSAHAPTVYAPEACCPRAGANVSLRAL
jgi:hypothetical protein